MAITQITRTENEILRDAREKLVEQVGISADNSTSTSLNLLKSVSREMSTMWDNMNDLLRRGFLSTAYGADLDEIGKGLVEPRSSAKRAMDLSSSNLQFYLDESYASNVTDLVNRYFTLNDRDALVQLQILDSASAPTSLTFPANLYVYAGNDIGFTTVNPIVISNTTSFAYTPIIANGVGSNYNVGAGVINRHNLVSLFPVLSKIADGIKVKNTFGIRNGGETESDDNYRFRLSNKVVSAVSSNETAIRKAVLSVPGIVDLSLLPRTHGNATFTVFPKSRDPILSDGLMNAVAASVANDKAFGTITYVDAPEYLAISLKLELRFAQGIDKNLTYSNVRLAVMNYINNIEIGGELVINEIIQTVMSQDDKILDMSITQFGFGIYERSTGSITSYTPLRLLNQRADWNEKFYINANLCSICQSGEK